MKFIYTTSTKMRVAKWGLVMVSVSNTYQTIYNIYVGELSSYLFSAYPSIPCKIVKKKKNQLKLNEKKKKQSILHAKQQEQQQHRQF